jgi:hypothetical protein
MTSISFAEIRGCRTVGCSLEALREENGFSATPNWLKTGFYQDF